MEQGEVAQLVTDGVLTILKVSIPMLGIGLVVGLIISILQAATQINEQTIVFVTKILAVFLSLIFFGQWMLQVLMEFTLRIFDAMVG